MGDRSSLFTITLGIVWVMVTVLVAGILVVFRYVFCTVMIEVWVTVVASMIFLVGVMVTGASV